LNSFFGSTEYGFQQHANRFFPAVTLLLSIWLAPCSAASPREDFVAWYREWLEAVPKSYSKTSKEFINRKREAPLTFKTSNWSDGEHRIYIVEDLENDLTYRLLVNPKYAASIETPTEHESSWSLDRVAFRGERDFRSVIGDFDTPEFLDPAVTTDTPFVQTSESGVNGRKLAEVAISFPQNKTGKPRYPKRIVVVLDGTLDYMPIEVRETEFGGIRTRKTISGWHSADGIWRYKHITTHMQTPETGKEVLHSTEDWNFAANQYPKLERQNECSLRYYGLPEPGVRGFAWRGVGFVIAVLLSVIGYFLMRKHM
jgi:hypothetical protein